MKWLQLNQITSVVDSQRRFTHIDKGMEWKDIHLNEAIRYNVVTTPMEIDEDVGKSYNVHISNKLERNDANTFKSDAVKTKFKANAFNCFEVDTANQMENSTSTFENAHNAFEDVTNTYDDGNTFQKPRVLKINSYKKTATTKDDIKSKRIISFKTVLCAFVSLLAILYLLTVQETCTNKNIDINKIREELLMEVVGQIHVIDILLENVDVVDKSIGNMKKILPFVGKTGVGKTYLMNILKRHYKNVVFEVNKMQLNNFIIKDELFNNFKKCESNLLIVDNLHVNNVQSVINFITSLPYDYKILVIIIFNVDILDDNLYYKFDTDNVNLIIENFNRSPLNCDIVTFNNVTYDDIKSWLIKELIKFDTPIHERDNIMNNVIDNHDIRRGFKGLQSKLLLEIERVN